MQGYNPTAFQQAIYQLLNSDLSLTALVDGVYSYVPEHTDYPYLVVQIDEITPYNTSIISGIEVVFSVYCFSQKSGQSECYAILQKVYEILQDATPTITGYAAVNTRFQDSQFDLLNDGITTRGSVTFRSVIQKN
jgi:hypothetical protein